MRVLTWGLRLLLFLFLFLFALKNAEPARLHFFFGQVWVAPLSLVLVAFFAAGSLLGVLAMAGSLFGARREAGRLKKELDRAHAALADATVAAASIAPSDTNAVES
ncbi:hypothetical protein AGMMS49545_07510 [Betaproteobacteria bacterium]|nr:hypothetical protein AGMMS49545_07510 [Betaproteobacteria bacterium]GHU44079.1 hypothetical protein AGMMS50289_11630 [Betaproteobacteria bacterium]